MAGLLVRLDRRFYARRAPVVARALIGTLLLHDGVGGIVVEAEAYDERDPASHSFAGRTARNSAMFGPPGHAYVYFTYGAHWCFNVVTAAEGNGEAVLIRAIEPLKGIARMEKRRPASKPRDLARGPGRLTEALGLNKSHDGLDLVRGPLGFWLPSKEIRKPYRRIIASPRIGITKGAETAWRFCASGSRFLTRPE